MARSKSEHTDWNSLKTEFVTGEVSLNELARSHGKSNGSVSEHAKKGDWFSERERFRKEVNEKAFARIRDDAVEEKVMLYTKTRESVYCIIDSIRLSLQDPKGLYRHLVQFEEEECTGDTRRRRKYSETPVFETINGRNVADIARAIKDLAYVGRTLDGIMDAAQEAKLQIEREKLELDKSKVGMADDQELDTGIAYMPGVDESLLDSAIPDPEEYT